MENITKIGQKMSVNKNEQDIDTSGQEATIVRFTPYKKKRDFIRPGLI